MIPLIPSLALAFVSFICSAFVILRIVVPILPPGPLSRRVAPSEFGLPNFRSLSLADKSQLWLHALHVISLAIFVWQAFAESSGGATGFADAANPLSAIRLWLAMTLPQTCLLITVGLTLLHVRLGRSMSFGSKHWMIWGPTVVLVVTSTALAGVLSGAGVNSLFVGLVAYASSMAVMSSIALVCLIRTLIVIKRNLTATQDESEPWPPMEEKPRPSFATDDIDALRDGASWITSNASSRRNSASAWSFSTHHTAAPSNHGHGRPQSASHPSVPAKSSFWFGNGSTPAIPPVPPLPAVYGPLSPTSESLAEADPFRRECPTPEPSNPSYPRQRMGSQTSWLTSTNGSQATLSAWSFPATHNDGASVYNASTPNLNAELLPASADSRPATPALASAQVLGGYGYTPQKDEEKGVSSLAAPGTSLDVSVYRAIGWLIEIWLPLALAYPYLVSALQANQISTASSILFILSITSPAPILACNLLFKSPLPIPAGLFDARSELPVDTLQEPSPFGSSGTYWTRKHKSTTTSMTTVVEGRRSGDVWLTNGDAMDGKSKMSRAFSLMAPKPKLSVLPPEDNDDQVTPPLPIQNDDSLPVDINTPRSETSAQFGRLRNESKASSHFSAADESAAYASRIMIAQRHYSAVAHTYKVSGSPERRASADANMMLNTAATTSVSRTRPSSGHLRTRSVSSVSGPKTASLGDSLRISPPPAVPLPPTPPNVRAARLAKHKKSFSSGFSFGPVDDLNEIDALTAGVLPLLVPGLKVGNGMKIKEGDWTPPGTFSKSKERKLAKMLEEFGGEFSSPEFHSTPATRPRQPRARKISHKKNHWSLPSLSLGKDGVHSLTQWSADVGRAFEKVSQYTTLPGSVDVRRNTVFGGESMPTHSRLQGLREENEPKVDLGRAMSTRSLGLRPEVPHGVDTARSSLVTLNMLPPSATATLFELDNDMTGPQAESTPHNNVGHKRTSDVIPPMPFSHRRSSIVYIKSDDSTPVTPANVATTSAMTSLARWPSRLIPKASKLHRKTSAMNTSSPDDSKSVTPGNGLRPLSLLQARDTNASPTQGTRPLQVGKKSKSRTAGLTHGDENKRPDHPRSKNKNLKSLQLVRSETSKMRGIIRKDEVLPDVIVRPPSQAVGAYAYSYQE